MEKRRVKAVLILAVCNIAVCGALLKLPLFNILGYEFSLITSLTGYIFALIYTFMTSPACLKDKAPTPSVFKEILTVQGINLAPLAFMTVKGFFVTNCNYMQGVEIYFLLPFVSSAFGFSVAFLALAAFSKRVIQILFVLFFSACLLTGSIFDIALGPTANLYNHIFGYFAGPIYDELFVITTPLVAYRIYSLATAIFLIWAGLFSIKMRTVRISFKDAGLGLLLLAALISANIFAEELGFSRDKAYIGEQLGAKAVSDNFVFYYSLKSQGRIKGIIDDFEFRHWQIRGLFGLKSIPKIEVFIYPDPDTQKDLMGARDVLVSNPISRQIHMDVNERNTGLIKHEITHIISGEFGIPFLRVSPRIALLEGLAEATVGYYRNLTLDEYVAGFIREGFVPDIDSYMTPWGFFREEQSKAYLSSGSFVKFLIERHGIDRFKKVYGGSSFEKTYGVPFETLEKGWLDTIKDIPLSSAKKARAESMVQKKSIFEVHCARELASISDKIGRCSSSAPTKEDCLALIKAGIVLSDMDPDQMIYSVEKLYEMDRCPEALDITDAMIKDDTIPLLERTRAKEVAAKCRMQANELKEAEAILSKLLKSTEEPEEYLRFGTLLSFAREGVYSRTGLRALEEKDAVELEGLLSKYPGLSADTVVLAQMAQFYYESREFSKAKKALSRLRNMRFPGFVMALNDRTSARTAFFLGDYEEATKIFTLIVGSREGYLGLFARDWLERIDFARNNTINVKYSTEGAL